MIKIEFPSNRTDIALAIGRALVEIGGQSVKTPAGETTLAPPVGRCVADPLTPEMEGSIPLESAGDDQDTRTDTKGVGFDDELCGNAAKPYYESGPRSGQWKKRKGVADTYYDEWYAEELAKLSPDTGTTDDAAEKPEIDVGAALGNQQTSTQSQAEVPANGGELMQWVSEKQTAGLLTPADVQAAYTALGIDVPALFGAEGGTHAPALHAILVQKAGQ